MDASRQSFQLPEVSVVSLLPEARPSLLNTFTEQVAARHAALYAQMMLEGKIPGSGWAIAYEITTDEQGLHHRCWPVQIGL